MIDRQHGGQARWVVMPTELERSAIDHVAQRLSRQFVHLNTELVARVVWDTYRHYDEHPNRDVVPILVQDAARDRLRVLPTTGRPVRQSEPYRGH